MARQPDKAPSKRQLRVGEALRHVLADLLLRGAFRDPDLQDVSITVTEVRTSPDLRNATAYVMPLGGASDPERAAAIVTALNRAGAFIRSQVARAVELKFVPSFAFELDGTFDQADRIDALLRVEPAGSAGPPTGTPDDGT